MNKRPLAVTIIGWLYMVMGATGFFYHLNEFRSSGSSQTEFVLIELVRIAAIAFGAFLLRGQNWARWLALAWMALHVVVGALHSVPEMAMHMVFLAALSYFLFRPRTQLYFASA